METDSRFAHACPDLDQEMPETETFDAWMTRTNGGRDTPVRTPFLEACERGEFAEERPEPFPTNPWEANHKLAPLARGLLDYFPDALAAVANCSLVCNKQHNPGEPMHWAYEKSTDEADALMRHLARRGKIDNDGVRHSAKAAWRALAMLQRELNGDST